MNMSSTDIATLIVEKILPKYFNYVHSSTEHNPDGSFSITYTEKTEKIYNEIVKLIENEKT